MLMKQNVNKNVSKDSLIECKPSLLAYSKTLYSIKIYTSRAVTLNRQGSEEKSQGKLLSGAVKVLYLNHAIAEENL